MKIGFVGNIPEPTGGAEVFLKEFLRYFLVDGCTTAVLARWRRQFFTYLSETLERVYASAGKIEKRENLIIHYLFEAVKRRKYERYTRYQSQLINKYTNHVEDMTKIFNQHKISLIHTHMLFPNLFFGYKTAQNLSLPLVLTIHGMLEFRILDHYKKKHGMFARRIEEMIPGVNKIIAVSSEIADECKKRGAKNVIKIPCGIDTEFFHPQNASTPSNDILFIGTLRKDKGAHLLIKAFCKISRSVKGNLVFLGKNLLTNGVMKQARTNPRIKFMGIQNKFKVRERIWRSGLVVLPSRNEGLPLSILEAMACEKPVLVTRTGELQDFIKNGINGFFLENRNIGHLARQMRSVLELSDLDIIGKRARESMMQFDIKNNVALHKKLYRSVLKDNGKQNL